MMRDTTTEHIIPLPDSAALAARLVAAVPDEWSDVGGHLDAPQIDVITGKALWNIGYAFDRFGPQCAFISRDRRQHVLDGELLSGMVLDQKKPGFVSLSDVGYGSPERFVLARHMAAGFLARGYTGWLRFSGGRHRKYAGDHPASMTLHTTPWQHVPPGKTEYVELPPAVLLTWDSRFGGKPEDIEPFVKICMNSTAYA